METSLESTKASATELVEPLGGVAISESPDVVCSSTIPVWLTS